MYGIYGQPLQHKLNGAGFNFTTDQLFTLAALPGLVGATLRFVYTYMPALIGGKNWTFISTLILLVPVVWLGFAVQDTTTSYMTFMILTALIGLAGGNFSSSMAYIGNFFPKSEKVQLLVSTAALVTLVSP